jgi:hypothetical protein
MNVFERHGPQGGEYFTVELANGEWLSVSTKPDDDRVWMGDSLVPTPAGQRGGIGTAKSLQADFFRRIAGSDEAREKYFALRALVQYKQGVK